MAVQATTGSIFDYSLAASPRRAAIQVAVVALAVVVQSAAAQFTLPLPFTAVPFVLTPMVVLLTGAALGWRLAVAVQILYLAAGIAGAPVFAPSVALPPGLGRLFGPTGGYLAAYPLAAFVTGWLAERGWDRRYLSSAAAMLMGLAVIFAGGVSWYAISITGSLPAAIAAGLAPFIVADVLKIAAAAAILPGVWRVIGRREPHSSRAS